jgi:hypothetical protein
LEGAPCQQHPLDIRIPRRHRLSNSFLTSFPLCYRFGLG